MYRLQNKVGTEININNTLQEKNDVCLKKSISRSLCTYLIVYALRTSL